MADETILQQDPLTAVSIANPAEWFFGVERLGFTTPHQISLSEIGVALVDPVEAALDADITALDTRLDAAEAQLLTLVTVTADITALDGRITILESGLTAPTAVVGNVALLAAAVPADGQLYQTLGYYTPSDSGANLYRYDAAALDPIDGGWVLNGPGGVGRYIALDQSVANVKQFGAVGDGVTDDATFIQNAIDAVFLSGGAVGGGGTVYLPNGRYLITTTLDLNTLRGVKIVGDGHHQWVVDPSAAFPHAISSIVWGGAPGGTMMLAATAEFTIRDLAFWGSLTLDTISAGVGFHLIKVVGVGQGSGYFTNVSFANIDIGIKMATLLADGNCESMIYDQIIFEDCRVCYEVNNVFGIGHRFGMMQAFDVDTVFHFNGGGMLDVEHIFCWRADELLRIDGDGTGVGQNQGTFNFNIVKYDANTALTPNIVTVSDPAGGGNRLIKFNTIRLPPQAILSDGRFLFDLAGGVYLHVEDLIHMKVAENILRLDGTGAYKPKALIQRGVITDTTKPAGWLNSGTFVTQVGAGSTWGFKDCRTFYTELRLPDLGTEDSLLFRTGATITFADGDATPDVSGVGIASTANTAPTTITALDNGIDGQKVMIRFNDANTLVDFTGTTLVGNGGHDWRPPLWAHMVCTKIGTNWYCDVTSSTETSAVYNVKDFGAVGDGVVDDTLAIQSVIDEIYARAAVIGGGGAIYMPAGRYNITTTLDFHNLVGLRIYGDGSDQFLQEPNGLFPRTASVLVWTGAAGGTLMTGGMQTFSFTDMTFWGMPVGGVTRAAIGFHLVATAGVGAGKGSFFRCTFHQFDTALKCGTALADVACDQMHLDAVRVLNCTTAFQAVNTQSIGHRVGFMYCDTVDTCFLFSGGGNMTVSHLSCHIIDTVLQINGDGTGVGQNNSTFVFEYVGIDSSNTVSPTLVNTEKVEASGNRTVKFAAARISPSAYKADGKYLVDVSGSIYVYLSDINFLHPAGAIANVDASFTYDPVVLFERCAVDAGSVVAAGFSQTPTFMNIGSGSVWGFRDTRLLANNVKLPDIGNHETLDFRSGNQVTAVANDATPDVSGVGILVTANSNPTTMTAMDNGVNGQTVVVYFNDNNTTVDFTGTLLKGNAGVDWTPVQGDHMTCIQIAGGWRCTISDNTA